MKAFMALICIVFSSYAGAEMISKSRMKEIAQNAESFKKDCAAFSVENKIKMGTIKNLTTEHLDPKDFGKLLGKELKIKNDKKANKAAQLQAVLQSKVFEQDQKRTTTYTLQLMLKKDKQELCQQQYVSQFVDRLASVH